MDAVKKLKVMPSIEEGRKEFSGFSPLSDRLDKSVRMLAVGEFFGGTTAFNFRAMLGLCGLLEEASSKGNPFDALIINGGALPEVPTRGSRGNRRKMEFLMDGIEDAVDSCEVMRRAVKRLVEAAGGTEIVYVMGEEDHENIEILVDKKIAESRKAEHMKGRIEGLKGEMSNLDSRIASMEGEKDSLTRELRALGKSIRRGSPGAKDERSRKRAEARIRKIAKLIKDIARKRNDIIERRRRTQGRMALMEDDLQNLGAVKRTNIEYITPKEAKELREDATREYSDLLHRLFEGANLRVLGQNVSLMEVGGLRVALGHSLENTSKTAKRGALASREQNQARLQLYGLLPQVDLFIFSHHPATKGWALPQSFASSHPMYLLQLGGFSEPSRLFDAYNRKIKTPHTEALDKHHLDSGATVIEAGADGAVSFGMLGLDHLEQHARGILAREHAFLGRRTGRANGEEPDDRLLAQMRLELPSRLGKERLGVLASQPELLRSYKDSLLPPPQRKITEVKAEMFSDHHIGTGNPWNDYSNQEIMRAEVLDSQARGLPDIIIFGGDMVEGALGSKLSEWNARNFLDDREFARLLRQRVESDPALGEGDFGRAMEEYYRRASFAYNVPNVDQQVHLLLPLLKHAAKVIASGGDAIFISGNHYNQSHRGEVFDESIRLASAVRMIGGFRENDPRIHIFYGGWIGSGHVTVKGIPIFGIHKGRSSRDHVTGLMEHRSLQRLDDTFLQVQGHHHDMSFGKTVTDANVSAPAIAPMIPFVDQAGLHAGLQGYTRMTLYVDQDEKHFSSLKVENRFLPQLEKYLKGIDPLFLEIFHKMVRKTHKS